MNIKQRIYLALAKSWWPHLTPLAAKITVGTIIFSTAATPVVIPVVKHAHLFNKPLAPATTVTTKSKPDTPAKPTTPVPAPATTPKASAPTPVVVTTPNPVPVQVQQPTPIPTTSPTPGSGAKGFSTSTSTGGTSNNSSSSTSTSTPSSGSTGPTDTTPASGGYLANNWAGYVATAGGYTSVSGEWKATNPTGNNTSTSGDSTWIGIGGVSGQDLIQTGTMNIVSAGGQVSPYAFYELLPDAALTIPSLAVSPGDDMTASISETSTNNWLIKINDVTTGGTYSTTASYTSSHSSAEWIQEDPSYANGTLVPMDNFVKATFISGNTIISGTSLDLGTSNAQPITMVDSSNQPIAIPSVVSNNGFFVTQN